VYYARSSKYVFEVSDDPLPEERFDCFIVPVATLKRLFHNRQRPDTWLPVIAYGDPQALSEAFHSGCRDYLKDPWDLAELDIRLNRLFQLHAPALVPPSGPALRVTGTKVRTDDGEAVLKPNEARILMALLKARGEVVNREVLYYAIWGKIKNSSSRVVDVHISALRKKLKALTPLQIVQVRGEGYLLS
jgi:DNA-binding response OmpR family regulator